MCYSSNNIAYFIGYEQVTGRLGDRSGSFVLQHNGTFEAGAVKDTLTVVPDSATGDLSGLLGEGVWGGDGALHIPVVALGSKHLVALEGGGIVCVVETGHDAAKGVGEVEAGLASVVARSQQPSPKE